jgi:hypothetical protein
MFRSLIKHKPHRKTARRQPTHRSRFFRPRLETLEVRLTPSTVQIQWQADTRTAFAGEWIAHIDGLPGDTRQVQLQAAQNLFAAAGVRADVQAIDHVGTDGNILVQSPESFDADPSQIFDALRNVPGIVYVEPHFADDGEQRTWFQTTDKGMDMGGESQDVVAGHSPPEFGITGGGVTTINGWEGIGSGQSFCSCQPPDNNGAVGPNYFVETVNTSLAIYNKTTGAILSGYPKSFASFFAPLGGELSFSDPVVAYDEISQKFVVGILDYNTFSQCRLDVAVSDTSDPTGTWTLKRYDVNDHVGASFDFADYPKLGYNADGWTFSFNMFPNFFGFFDHVTTLSVKKSDLSGFLNVVPGGFNNFTYAPATMHGSTTGNPMWFVEDGKTGGDNNVAHVIKEVNPYSATPTWTDYALPINSYVHPPRAQQPGGGQTIDTIDARFYFSALRNNHLVAAHTVGAGGVARVRWYDFDLSGATPKLNQEGEINPSANVNTFFPSIDISPTGIIGLNYSQTSTTAPSGYWSMIVTAHTPSDPPGVMETPVVAKQGVHHSNEFRAGDYSSLMIDPVDGTFWGVNEWADNNADSGFTWSSWITHFRAEPPAGASVINQVPTSPVGSIGSLRLTFDESIDPTTFTAAKIASFTDPTGAAITVSGVAAIAGTNNTQFDVSFPAQTLLGTYTMTIGPDIRDVAGHQMDQNHNGIPGEIPGDQYVAKFTLQGPKIIDSTPSGSSLPKNVDHVRVTFNEPMDPTTFFTDQVSFTGPNGPIPINDVVTVAGSNSTQFDVLFDPVAATGTYDMVIGPNIQDFFGNAMDQNGNFITGEIPGDQYEAKFSLQGPKIVASSIDPGKPPPNFLPGALTSVQVTFNEPMDPTTFGNDQVVFTAPDGSTFIATDIVTVAGSNNTKFNILFAANTTGSYVMTIGPNIRDAFGNAMDQNGNLNTGEIPDDQYVLKFNVLGPRINSSVTLGDNTNQLFNDVRVIFNEPMDPTTFTSDQVSFKGPGGSTIAVTSITPVTGSNNTQFDVGFDPQGKIGNYTMIIGPNVDDTFGNAMDQNGNLKPGEIPGDQYTTTFAVMGPRITGPSPFSSQEPITSLRVTFSKPIDVTTFTPAKIASFRGPNGPLGISGIFAVPGTNFTQFDVDFLPQSTTGTYTMVIGPDIHDLAGNAMDQNNNLIPGEIPGDQFTATFTMGGLRITTSPNGGILAPGTFDHVRLTFNAPVNPSTFTPAIVSLTGPGGALTVNAVTPVPFTDNTQFDVSFDPLGVTGNYSLVVAPTMQDLYGNKLDQNGNLIPGEDPADRFTMTFGILGPKVTGTISLKSGPHTISGVRLTFNEPMDPTSFTLDQAVLQSPTGATIPITDVSPVDGSNNAQFDVSFAPQSTAGNYTLTVGPNVDDTFGNAMDQNGNLKPGEIPGDQFVYKFNPAQINLLYVGANFTGWNDGSLLITQVSTSQFATRSFAGFDEIWVDETVSNGDPNVYKRSADLAAFVSAGGGLVTDAAFTDYGFVPNAGTVKAVGFFCSEDVKETTLGKSHPILAGITDAGLQNWGCSWHSYFSATGGMDVLATSSNTTQALILAGTFGSGRLVYLGLDPTFHWPAGQSVPLMRQVAQWAVSSGAPGGSGGSGAFPGDPSVVPPETPTAPADQVFAAIGKQSVQENSSALDGVLAVNVLSKVSSPPAETVRTGLDLLVSSPSGAGAINSLFAPTWKEGFAFSGLDALPASRSAIDPFDPLADSENPWDWRA